MTAPAAFEAAAYAYARARVRDGELPREAAVEAWSVFGLHGDDRQAFIDRIEATHLEVGNGHNGA